MMLFTQILRCCGASTFIQAECFSFVSSPRLRLAVALYISLFCFNSCGGRVFIRLAPTSLAAAAPTTSLPSACSNTVAVAFAYSFEWCAASFSATSLQDRIFIVALVLSSLWLFLFSAVLIFFLAMCFFCETSLFGVAIMNCAMTFSVVASHVDHVVCFSVSAAIHMFLVHEYVVQLFLCTFWCLASSLLVKRFSVHRLECCEVLYHQPLLHPVSSLVPFFECVRSNTDTFNSRPWSQFGIEVTTHNLYVLLFGIP